MTLAVALGSEPGSFHRAAEASLGRRRLRSRVLQAACLSAVLLALLPLGALIVYTVGRGAGVLSFDFFAHTQRPEGIPGGGIENALAGTAVIDGLALALAVPIGLLVAIYLSEGPGRIRAAIRFGANVLAGIPSIVIGLFAYIVLVAPLKHFSGLSASFALAVLMLPVMIRADEEALLGVPESLWEAGLALGAGRPRVMRSVVLRTALPGLVTGNLLALARAVGETAPLLFTAIGSQFLTFAPTHPMASMPLLVYLDGTQPFPDAQAQAWGTALVLLVGVLVLSLAGRLFAQRLTRRAR